MARGGEALDQDRLALPQDSNGERIRTGDAVATTCHADQSGYGDLFARTVIHAVGPAYGSTQKVFWRARRGKTPERRGDGGLSSFRRWRVPLV